MEVVIACSVAGDRHGEIRICVRAFDLVETPAVASSLRMFIATSVACRRRDR
jgi:hypothetical protein